MPSNPQGLLAELLAPRGAELGEEALRILAADALPLRTERIEPRALKRRSKPYDRLTRPRHQFREIRHRNNYYAGRRRGAKCPKKSKA